MLGRFFSVLTIFLLISCSEISMCSGNGMIVWKKLLILLTNNYYVDIYIQPRWAITTLGSRNCWATRKTTNQWLDQLCPLCSKQTS